MAFRIVLTCCKGIGLLFLASAIIKGRQSPRKRHNIRKNSRRGPSAASTPRSYGSEGLLLKGHLGSAQNPLLNKLFLISYEQEMHTLQCFSSGYKCPEAICYLFRPKEKGKPIRK